MKKLTTILLIAVAGFCSTLNAQTDSKKAPAMSKEEEEMMRAWTAYATPGEPHKMLAKDNGIWNEEMIMWMTPGTDPIKSSASCVNTMILGGRYQQSVHTGSINGEPFEGISTVGYDNAKKKYVSTWVDNMGTGIMVMEGVYDAASKTINLKGKQVDPASGKEMDVREEFTLVDDNTQIMRMYMTPVGGKEYKTMEIRFTRQM